MEKLYEGKAKIVTPGSTPDTYFLHFKDDATAFNGQKRATIEDKGRLNAAISARLFTLLAERGVPSHFVRQVEPNVLEVWRLLMIPLEVVVRNVIAGSLSKRLGRPEGEPLERPVVEFYYKDDALGDPLVNEDHIRALGAARPDELRRLSELALAVNEVLRAHFGSLGVTLVDFKLEFGRRDGDILLGDEITPDTCRLWDAATGEKLDKDRFRRDLGGVEAAYREVLRRLGPSEGA
jgi:phosphoribosylaminoimidazole-succinocarboxamide synthase